MNPTRGFWEEFNGSMRAVAGICLNRPNAQKGLDISARGFVNSFFAFIVLMPLFALLCASQWDIAHDPHLREFLAPGIAAQDTLNISFTFFLWTRMTVSLIHFLAFPAAMFALTSILGRKENYLGFIVGWNWASIPASLLFLLPVVLFKVTLAMPLLAFPLIALWLVALWIFWRVIRVLLKTEWLTSVGVLVLWGALATVFDLLYSALLV